MREGRFVMCLVSVFLVCLHNAGVNYLMETSNKIQDSICRFSFVHKCWSFCFQDPDLVVEPMTSTGPSQSARSTTQSSTSSATTNDRTRAQPRSTGGLYHLQILLFSYQSLGNWSSFFSSLVRGFSLLSSIICINKFGFRFNNSSLWSISNYWFKY